jgi:hypothetical protein
MQINKCNTFHNRIKDKNHTIISTDEEKAFNKIPYHDKSPKETRKRKIMPQKVNCTRQTYSQHYPEIAQSVLLQRRNKKIIRCYTLIQYSS